MSDPEPGAGRPLRVGLVLPSGTPAAWIGQAVENLVATGARLDVVCLAQRRPRRRRGRALVRAWLAVDRRLMRPRPDPDALRPLIGLPHPPDHGEDPWPPVRDAAPDVVFCLGVRPDPPAPDGVPLGVWCLVPDEHGDLGFDDTVGDLGAVAIALRRLDGDGPDLRLSWSRVQRHSPAITRARALWKAARLPALALGDLRDGRAPGDEAMTAGGDRARSPAGVVGAAARLAGRALRTGTRRLLTRNDWFLAYQLEPAEPVPADLSALTPIPVPTDRFWADPFPVIDGERCCIFVEEWVHALGRGVLAVLEVGRDGRWRRLGLALERPFHLSHPFLFRWQGQLFLLPETSTNGTLELYRCREFPLGWELETVLMADVRLVDATLHEHEGRWWMFAVAGADPGPAHEELHLFHADTPLGPWSPHPANPVRCDPRAARPAGSLFEWRGRLCRPAQDCGVRYGRAIVIHEVEELSPARYRERAVTRLEPRDLGGADRMHTLNTAGWLTVVDAHRDRWRRPT